MAKVLLIAEHDGTTLNSSTAKCVACAAQLEGAEIDVAVLANSAADVAAAAAALDSVQRVLTVENPANEKPRVWKWSMLSRQPGMPS